MAVVDELALHSPHCLKPRKRGTKMDLTHTRYEVENGVARITLHRPDMMNAITETMRNELIEIFSEADPDDAVQVIVVTGAGEAFCAGADLSSGGSPLIILKNTVEGVL
jgi:enoyl-CoA hydratase/carnithine racemase